MSPPPRPHPLTRSRFATWADRAVAWSWRGPNEKPPLEPGFLWRKGSAGFAAEDETAEREPQDAADFRERLAGLCASLQGEAQLNALGHAMAYGQLKAAVRTRHRLGRMWRRQPEMARTAIAPPIIVVGQMRSGTTRLHRLLAADPRHAGTRLCDSIEPVPRRPDIRPLRCAAGLAMMKLVNPWLETVHPFAAAHVDEELGWLASGLNPAALEVQWRIPSFVAFSEARDPAPVYREFARILRSDAAARGDADKPRVLKCPQYAEDLAALLAQFPDARVVMARRDSRQVLDSTVSVVANQMACQSDHASLEEIEQEWRRKLALRDRRMVEALARFSGPIAEVEFDAIGRDWRGDIARVYAALDIELAPEALAAMEKVQAAADHSAHRLHAGIYRRFARA